MPAYLTSDQIALLKKSFRQLDTERTASLFYQYLFERHPEVRPLFSKDMGDLQSKLMSVFELVIFSFDEKAFNKFGLQDSVIMSLRELGNKHDEKGVKPKHYEMANSLLLETMVETGGPVFTDAVKQAWQLALVHLTGAMLNQAVKPSAQIKKETGSTMRETFSYIIRKLQGQPG